MEHGKIDARLVLVAVNNGKRELNLLDFVYSSQSLIGSGGYRPEDVTDVLEIMKSKRWDLKKMITEEYDISELAQAIEKAGDTEHAGNVIVHF